MYSFPWLDRWWNPFRYQKWKAFWELQDLFRQIARQKREEYLKHRDELQETEKKHRDILSLLVEASLEDDGETKPLSEEEVLQNIATFFLAGHDTTATSLTAEMYFLAKHHVFT